MFYVGTSGYSYKDWIGTFYPERIKRAELLRFYSKEFKFLELNYTFYRIPEAKNLARMETEVPEDFRFVLKLNRLFTHDEEFDISFRQALKGMSHKLKALLAQFPYSFQYNIATKEHVLKLRDFFPEHLLTYEFRHSSWAHKEALDFIKKEGLGICSVDEPPLKGLLPPLVLPSGDFGYVRFHGRNHKKWWGSNDPHERYMYEYSKDELLEWLPRLEYLNGHFKTNYIAFNNHYNAKAVRASRLFKSLLEDNKMLFR